MASYDALARLKTLQRRAYTAEQEEACAEQEQKDSSVFMRAPRNALKTLQRRAFTAEHKQDSPPYRGSPPPSPRERVSARVFKSESFRSKPPPSSAPVGVRAPKPFESKTVVATEEEVSKPKDSMLFPKVSPPLAMTVEKLEELPPRLSPSNFVRRKDKDGVVVGYETDEPVMARVQSAARVGYETDPYSRSVAARIQSYQSYLNFAKKNCECLNLEKLGRGDRLLIYDKIKKFLYNIEIPDIENLTYTSILSYIYEEIRKLINNPEHGKALIECLKKDIKFKDEGVYVRVNDKVEFYPVTFETNHAFLLKLQEDMIKCIEKKMSPLRLTTYAIEQLDRFKSVKKSRKSKSKSKKSKSKKSKKRSTTRRRACSPLCKRV